MTNSKEIKELIARIETLEQAVFGISSDKKIKKISDVPTEGMEFDLNDRAFFKQYTAKKMNGPKKFTLIVAYKAKGVVDIDISLKDIEKTWKKMKGLLEVPFQRIYGTRAKENAWLNSERDGLFSLSKEWKKIFRK